MSMWGNEKKACTNLSAQSICPCVCVFFPTLEESINVLYIAMALWIISTSTDKYHDQRDPAK